MLVYFVGILLNASTSPDENDAIDVEMQCDMLFIVSSLCEGDTHRKVSGVPDMALLERTTQQINSNNCKNTKFALNLTHCITFDYHPSCSFMGSCFIDTVICCPL